MVLKALSKIGGMTDISSAGIEDSYEDIREVHFESNNEREFRSANRERFDFGCSLTQEGAHRSLLADSGEKSSQLV